MRLARLYTACTGFFVVLLPLLAACGKEQTATPSTQDTPREIVLHRGNGTEPSTMDPHKATGLWESAIIAEMIFGLYTYAADASPIPGAAIAHDISENGLTHTFKMRPGMVWSDGVPVSAHDFVAGWQRVLDPMTASEYASLAYGLKNGRPINLGEMPPQALGVRAIDDATLQVELEYPMPYIKTLLTHQIFAPVPAHAVKALGDDWLLPGSMLANGAYRLAEWRPNSHVKLVRNERFYDNENVEIDTVFFYPTENSTAALRRFRAGELDTQLTSGLGVPINDIERLRKNMPGAIREFPLLSTTYIAFNMERAPYDDIRVRRALGLAINRDILTNKVLKGGQMPTYALVPPIILNYTDQRPAMAEATLSQGERLALATSLLEQAGYTAETPLTISIKYRRSSERDKVMVAMQHMWQQIGVNVVLDGKEPKIAYSDYRVRSFEIADAGWVGDYNDPENFLFLARSDTGPMNYSGYKNPRFDALMDQATHTLNLTKRAELMAQAEQIMLDDLPLVPLYNGATVGLVGEHVQGWVSNVDLRHLTRFLSIDESKRRKY